MGGSAQHTWFWLPANPGIRSSGHHALVLQNRAVPELAVSHYIITGASGCVLADAEVTLKKARTGTRERTSDAIGLFGWYAANDR